MESIILAKRNSRRHKLVAAYRALDGLDSCLSPRRSEKIEKPDIGPLNSYIPFEQGPFYNAQTLAAYLSEYFNNCVLPDRESEPAGAQYSDWGNFGFGDLVDLTRGSRWQVKTTWHMPQSGVPHMVVMMFSEMAKGQALFHGEIKTAIRIMHRRLKTSALRQHILAPVSWPNTKTQLSLPDAKLEVLLFSAIGEHHLRVIKAYHDDEQLVMRTTPLFDLRKRDDDLFIQLSRWCLGGPSSKPTTPT
ncbi:uncharacterized protein BDV17DRAFT_288535 [Aspergillus undulatus]|uniref:uncharacterized protein n=1 Tax=Aspergillus undulatus TaxID=1810928 RepID=UPI003CCD9377